MSEPAWKAANRAHWDELVALHLSPRGSDLTSLRERRRRLNAIEEAELWPVDGQYILHLQCHFGADTLTLAQRGATVVGVDFGFNVGLDTIRSICPVSIGTGIQAQSRLKPKIWCGRAKPASGSIRPRTCLSNRSLTRSCAKMLRRSDSSVGRVADEHDALIRKTIARPTNPN